MAKKIRKQAGRLYFSQNDIIRPLGGFLLVAGLVWFYVGFSYASYIGPCIMVPVGLVLFIVGSSRHISDNDMTGECEHLLEGYDKAVTDMEDYDRMVLKQPADVATTAYSFGEGAAFFKKAKAGAVISDILVRSHFFFTKEALLVCARRVSLTDMDVESGTGFTDVGGRFAFADMDACRIEENTGTVILTNSKKPATVHRCELVIEGKDGAGELLRLPVGNDMDMSNLCEAVNRLI